MTANQILAWRVIIIACVTIGAILALSWLVTGRWTLSVPFGVILLVFATVMAVMLRRSVGPKHG